MVLSNGVVLSAEVSLTQPTCNQTNGSINITPVGGVAPYTYLWSNQARTEDLSGLGPGNYVVTIRDAAGCFTNKLYTLTEVGYLLLQYGVTPASCNGDNTGAINLSIIGGIKPYKIQWQDGQVTEDRMGLAPGTYPVSVTDAVGCTTVAAISVNRNTLQVNSSVTQPVCAEDLGSITITPVDGSSPYTYNWSNGATGSTVGGLPAGNYIANIEDASGCSTTQSFFIVSPTAIVSTAVIHNTECGGANAYAIDLTVTGGNAPYTYTWSTGATTKDVSGLSPGTFEVDIKDALGCIVHKEFIVSPSQVNWSCLIQPPAAPAVCGSAGNTLATSVTNATSYQWSVTSTDNKWSITSGEANRNVVYTAGSAGSSATFSLTITKDGCTRTCSFDVTGGCVVRDNTGGGDPSSDDPCARPAVAETAQVFPEETVHEERTDSTWVSMVNVYPNPFNNNIRFEWSSPDTDRVRLEVFDLSGRRQLVIFEGEVTGGKQYAIDSDAEKLRDGVHYLRFTTSTHVDYLKIMKVK
jgi:hypothetical protein